MCKHFLQEQLEHQEEMVMPGAAKAVERSREM